MTRMTDDENGFEIILFRQQLRTVEGNGSGLQISVGKRRFLAERPACEKTRRVYTESAEQKADSARMDLPY